MRVPLSGLWAQSPHIVDSSAVVASAHMAPTQMEINELPSAVERRSAVLRHALFVVLSAAIVAVGSERMFWYWTTDPLSHIELSLFYAPAVGFALWAVERYRVDDAWVFLLTTPLLAYWVEGVVTPIVYSGGPFVPVFPVWFTAWHGLLSLVVLWYLFRRWLVAGRWRPLLATSVGVGLFWGAWSMTLTLPENLNDPDLIADHGQLQALAPLAFARYTVVFTAILAGAHYLLGRVWVRSYRPARITRWLWAAVTVGMLVVWTTVYPWAGPMFVVYVALQIWILRRHRARSACDRSGAEDVVGGRSLLADLHGRIPLRSLWPLAAIPAAAAPTYALLWELGLAEQVWRSWMYTVIGVQSLIAVGLLGYSFLRVLRPPRPSVPPPPGPTSDESDLGPGQWPPPPLRSDPTVL